MNHDTAASYICFKDLPKILYKSREWHRRQQMRHPMHPVIDAAYQIAAPVDYAQLCLEWPYVSDTDKTRLAYTADDRAAAADRQTITSVGKYLKRHWPGMQDHTIRDFVAKFATASTFVISTEASEIVRAVQEGPSSCMKWSENHVRDLGCHPYETYDPQFGWCMAMRLDGNRITGRALVMNRQDGDAHTKYFVRTYRQGEEGQTFSGPDEELRQWLFSQGYDNSSGWEGEKLAYIAPRSGRDHFVAPYIDGDSQTVDYQPSGRHNSVRHLRICNNGEYECTSQNGGYEEQNRCTCDDCGSRMSEDDSYGIGEHYDSSVCSSCIDNYQRAIGRRGNEYYVLDGDVVIVEGEAYEIEHLSDNDIVQLHDGDYAKTDDAVFIEAQGEYYLCDDDEVVQDHEGEYQLKEDCIECEDGEWALDGECWCCEVSGEYYRTDDTDPVVIRGMNFHEDVSATDMAEALNAEPDVRYSGVAEVKDGECVWVPADAAQTELVLEVTPLCEAVVAAAHRAHNTQPETV